MRRLPQDRVESVSALASVAEELLQSGEPRKLLVANGIFRWLSGEVADLAEAVGVAPGQAQRDVRTLLALHRRDEAVREAVAVWSSIDELERDLARYHATGWRHDRRERTLPQRLAGRKEAHLWRILREIDRPIRRSQIYRIVARAD